MTYSRIIRLAGFAACAAVLSTAAQAQQNNRPWGFTEQNRAQIAVAMKQMEDGGAAGGGSAGGGTTIVCGGGSATATANNTCIILNNSEGVVTTDQISDGDQSASNSEEVTMNGEPPSGADEVMDALTN